MFISALCLTTMAAEPQQQDDDVVDLGHSVPLYGPWSFCVGDSPPNPATGGPRWADADFDDSSWETLNLWPDNWTDYPGARDHAYVPGWTARGHAGHSGYAWYRIRVVVKLRPQRVQWFALAVPDRVEDAYQLFMNGALIGQSGDFRENPPKTYHSQPTRFVFTVPPSSHPYSTPYPLVFAFRVWMGPGTLSTSYEPGGLRSKPILGTANEIELMFLHMRSNLINSQLPLIVCAASFSLLAIFAFSLTLFAGPDRTYIWMGIAFALMAISSGLRASDLTSQLALNILEDRLLVQCFFQPLAYLAWLAVWSTWFGREKRWILAGAALTSIHMITNVRLVTHGSSSVLDSLSLLFRLMLIVLLLWAVFPGIRRRSIEQLLTIPAVVLLALRAVANENLIERRVHGWTFFDAQFSVAQLVDVPLAAVLALLLVHRLRMAARRNRAFELDAKRAQVQSDFVAAVSHEFRSPLTTIRTITDLLTDDRIPDEALRRQSFQYLRRETRRLQSLVEDLLVFGKIESGTSHYRLITCDAFRILKAVVADFREQAEATGFDIELDLTPESALIRADEESFRRIIRNLLENAVKYSPTSRQIWVLGAIEKQMVLLSVRDRGMGIDPTDQRAIFQRFYRGSAAKKAGIKGTGIGLAMAQQICDAMGGEIHLQSEVGIGSTFTVVFPLVKE